MMKNLIINIVSISRFRLTPTCCSGSGTYLSFDRVLQVGRSHRYIFCHMHLNIYVHFEKCQKTKHKKEEIFFFFSLSPEFALLTQAVGKMGQILLLLYQREI